MEKEIRTVLGLFMAGIIWWNFLPIIHDQFYSQASTFNEPIRSLWMLIGSLFDPTVEIILALIAIILHFSKN